MSEKDKLAVIHAFFHRFSPPRKIQGPRYMTWQERERALLSANHQIYDKQTSEKALSH